MIDSNNNNDEKSLTKIKNLYSNKFTSKIKDLNIESWPFHIAFLINSSTEFMRSENNKIPVT